jgi:hypothetical protein
MYAIPSLAVGMLEYWADPSGDASALISGNEMKSRAMMIGRLKIGRTGIVKRE